MVKQQIAPRVSPCLKTAVLLALVSSSPPLWAKSPEPAPGSEPPAQSFGFPFSDSRIEYLSVPAHDESEGESARPVPVPAESVDSLPKAEETDVLYPPGPERAVMTVMVASNVIVHAALYGDTPEDVYYDFEKLRHHLSYSVDRDHSYFRYELVQAAAAKLAPLVAENAIFKGQLSPSSYQTYHRAYLDVLSFIRQHSVGIDLNPIHLVTKSQNLAPNIMAQQEDAVAILEEARKLAGDLLQREQKAFFALVQAMRQQEEPLTAGELREIVADNWSRPEEREGLLSETPELPAAHLCETLLDQAADRAGQFNFNQSGHGAKTSFGLKALAELRQGR